MLERAPYPTDHIASRLLRLLLAQDGSTTRLCETVSGQSVAFERIQTDADALAALLFKVVGLPDPAASRAYTIASSDGPFMLIFETYRAGFVQAFKNPIHG